LQGFILKEVDDLEYALLEFYFKILLIIFGGTGV
jgi:hypothetical protein